MTTYPSTYLDAESLLLTTPNSSYLGPSPDTVQVANIVTTNINGAPLVGPVISADAPARLTNKTLVDDSVFFVNPADATKRIGFTTLGVAAGATVSIVPIAAASRALAIPDPGADTELVTAIGAQTLTNKSLVDTSTFVVNVADPTRRVAFDAAGVAAGATVSIAPAAAANRLLTIPDPGADTELITAIGAQTLTNKSLVDTSTLIVNAADPTRRVAFDASGVAPAATVSIAPAAAADCVLTIPDPGVAASAFVVADGAQTLNGPITTGADLTIGTTVADYRSLLVASGGTRTAIHGLADRIVIGYNTLDGVSHIDATQAFCSLEFANILNRGYTVIRVRDVGSPQRPIFGSGPQYIDFFQQTRIGSATTPQFLVTPGNPLIPFEIAVGAGGNVYMNSTGANEINIDATDIFRVRNVTNATNTTTAAFVSYGGIAAAQDIYLGGLINFAGSQLTYSTAVIAMNVATGLGPIPASPVNFTFIKVGPVNVVCWPLLNNPAAELNFTFTATPVVPAQYVPYAPTVANIACATVVRDGALFPNGSVNVNAGNLVFFSAAISGGQLTVVPFIGPGGQVAAGGATYI